jgi:hypothetical protein
MNKGNVIMPLNMPDIQTALIAQLEAGPTATDLLKPSFAEMCLSTVSADTLGPSLPISVEIKFGIKFFSYSFYNNQMNFFKSNQIKHPG